MKITLEGDEGELEAKTDEIVKAIWGDGYELVKSESKREMPFYKAGEEHLEFWDRKFKNMLKEIKEDINGILK